MFLSAKDYVAGRPLTQDVWKRQYVFNLFSHNSSVDINTGYNEEETKVMKETRKIFGDNTVSAAVTCVRVPVLRAHCEAINITLRYALFLHCLIVINLTQIQQAANRGGGARTAGKCAGCEDRRRPRQQPLPRAHPRLRHACFARGSCGD